MDDRDQHNPRNRIGAQGLDWPWFGVNYDQNDQEEGINLSQVQGFRANLQPLGNSQVADREVKLIVWMVGGQVIELSVHENGYRWFLAALNSSVPLGRPEGTELDDQSTPPTADT